MRRILPTLSTLVVMLVASAAYWADLIANTDPVTGLVENGSVWLRYLLMLVPVGVCAAATTSLGPRAISVLRTRSWPLAVLFGLAGAAGVASGGVRIVVGLQPFALSDVLWGVLFVWYGVWMVLAAVQLGTQRAASPTKSAFFGLVAAVPFCILAIARVLTKPASLYRSMPLVRILAAMCLMMWLGMLLRGMYIALVRSRAKWMYFFGLLSFFFALLETVQTFYMASLQAVALSEWLEVAVVATLGLAALGLSLATANRGTAESPLVKSGDA